MSNEILIEIVDTINKAIKDIDPSIGVVELDRCGDYFVVNLADGESQEALCETILDPGFQSLHYLQRCELAERILEKAGYKHLNQEGGGEGGAEYCTGVFALGDNMYSVDWSYYSHHGYEVDGALSSLCRVERRLVRVEQYFAI